MKDLLESLAYKNIEIVLTTYLEETNKGITRKLNIPEELQQQLIPREKSS